MQYSRGLQSHCSCQFRLTFIEGPEALRLQFKRASHVQAIECADSEFRAITACQVGAEIKGVFRDRGFTPDSRFAVALKRNIRLLRG